MIDALQRFVLMYDLHLRTARKETQMPTLSEMAPALIKRVSQNMSRLNLATTEDNTKDSPWLTLKRAKKVERNGNSFLALLFSIGDPRGADPAFEHSQTGDIRIEPKKIGEGKSVTAHGVLSLTPHGNNNYKLVLEDVRGLGRSRLRDLLGQEFRKISEEYGLEYTNNAGKNVATHIIPELKGYADEKISTALKRSTLSGVYLTGPADQDMDEIEGAKPTSKQIKFTVVDETALEKVRAWANKNHYDKMRITWNDPKGPGKPTSASVDVAQKDVKDTFYVKQTKINLSSELAEACSEISDDMIDKILGVKG